MNPHPFPAVPRRRFLATVASCAGALAAGPTAGLAAEPGKGRLRQAVCPGVFRGLELDFDGICREAARLGVVGIDLVGPDAFPTLKKHGLVPTMVPGGGGIKEGINDRRHHAGIDGRMRAAIKAAAEAGAPNVIVMAGDRQGLTDEQGLDNAVAFLDGIKALAEDLGITLCMELLNSKVDHPGYMCDHTAWGVEVCKRVASPRVKLLYDIYHMQIMEGDIIRTIRENIEYIGHFHTAGNPGRKDLDEDQELYYPAIMRTIAQLQEEGKFDGYVAHEFTPKNGMESLRKAVQICDV